MKKIMLPTVLSAALLAGCATGPKQSHMTPLQIQSMQTRSFKADKRKAFNATMEVFQDMGYTVKSANYDTGFISSQSMTQDANKQMNGFLKVVKVLNDMNQNHRESMNYLTKATAFVAPLPDHQVRIRLSFVGETSTSVNGGNPNKNDKQILSAKVYNDVFNRIQQALFVGTTVS